METLLVYKIQLQLKIQTGMFIIPLQLETKPGWLKTLKLFITTMVMLYLWLLIPLHG